MSKVSTGAVNERLVGTHWGNFLVSGDYEEPLRHLRPVPEDPHPATFSQSLLDGLDPAVRVERPMVRKAWLEDRERARSDQSLNKFVPVEWDFAVSLVAEELDRVRTNHGNSSIFGGSYGWASAGRFHHAQSQIHRFLNFIGGYTRSVNSYSAAAAEVVVPHILGLNPMTMTEPSWQDIVESTELLVAFGGICLRNSQVVSGGISEHVDEREMLQFANGGGEIINISPMRDDLPKFMPQRWIPCRPSTDTALMLGLAHTLLSEDLYDHHFVKTHCTGFGQFEAYLRGVADGVAKDANWASAICGVSAEDICDLAQHMSRKHTLLTISLSLQRAQHGELTYWAAITLAAMLGKIGTRGGGIGLAWGSNGRGHFGRNRIGFSWGKVDQGHNQVADFIPVARISDMLLHPGASFTYNGGNYTYPEVKLVYWAGGNPYHHHQDLNRLCRAWEKPDTVIVHESVWTATARRADIVLPATTFLERNDIICGLGPTISPSQKVCEPYGRSRNDYDIFADIAEKIGCRDSFTEGLHEMGWLRKIYEEGKINASRSGITLPSFDDFWTAGKTVDISSQLPPSSEPLARFRSDPLGSPLPTPSGRIEIYSSVVASFHYPDCPGMPVWVEKSEQLGSERSIRYPLHLLSPQPANKLHSQLDFARTSRDDKLHGHERLFINPADAVERGISDGSVVRVHNDRGALLAAAIYSESLMRGVLHLPTGAWWDLQNELDVHGNPNTVCADVPTSSLAQGCTAQSCLVEVEPYQGKPQSVSIHELPTIAAS